MSLGAKLVCYNIVTWLNIRIQWEAVTFGRLAKRMDLGHTRHSKPWKAMGGWHTFPEMGAVPEPMLLTDHYGIVNKSQSL